MVGTKKHRPPKHLDRLEDAEGNRIFSLYGDQKKNKNPLWAQLVSEINERPALLARVKELEGALLTVLRAYEADAKTKDDYFAQITNAARALLNKKG